MDEAPDRAPAIARLTIDLGALVDNWRAMAVLAPSSETAAVVKADAYGIGVGPAVKALVSAGCATFFVATSSEGEAVRGTAPDANIYVLDGLTSGDARRLAAKNLRPVLGSPAEVQDWVAESRSDRNGGPAIHIDTGMNRLGLAPVEARDLAANQGLMSALKPSLVISHLACADEPNRPMNRRQRDAFANLAGLFPGVPASLANSAGIMLGADFQFDVTRPGIALYGARAIMDRAPLKPVVTAEARILRLRDATAGATIGYGARQTLDRDSRLAVLGVGYADGYLRSAGSTDQRKGSHVVIRGQKAPLVGRVSMDLMVADLTDIDGVERGDWAELFGKQLPIDEVAECAGTIGYELLTGLGARYARTYIESS